MCRNWVIKFWTFFILGFFVFILPKNTYAKDYYVNPAGNDTNTGTQSSPFKTLSKGNSVLVAGDTLYVSGNYTTTLNITKSGNTSAPIKYIGQNLPKINVGSNASLSINIAADYVVVDGFDAFGGNSHGLYTTRKHIQILNNKIHGGAASNNGSGTTCTGSAQWGSGLKLAVGAEDILIKGNEVYENCGEGLAVTRGVNVRVENNVIRDNYSVNLYLDNSPFTTAIGNQSICTGTYLRDGNRPTAILLGNEFYDGWGSQSHDILVENNKTSGCNKAIRLYNPINGPMTNIIVRNNCYIGTVDSPFASAAGATLSNNVACGSTGGSPIPVPKVADMEPDGDVDGNDYLTLIASFGLTGSSGWIRSDIIRNGKVDIFDFNKLITNFGL